MSFAIDDARELASVFQERNGYRYGRQINRTVTAVQEKITLMEKSYETIAFGDGMTAIGSTIFLLPRPRDHLIPSSFLFGNKNSLFQSFIEHRTEISFVDVTCAEYVWLAIREQSKRTGEPLSRFIYQCCGYLKTKI